MSSRSQALDSSRFLLATVPFRVVQSYTTVAPHAALFALSFGGTAVGGSPGGSMQADSAQQVAALQAQAQAQALLGGYKVDELVFYIGPSQTFADGDKVVHGQQGKVAGMLRGNTHLAVLFPGNKGFVGLGVEVRRLR